MIDDDTTSSERIEDSIKSPYPEDGDVWGALSEALASEFEEHEAALKDVRAAKFVDEAAEAQLEKLADLFEFDRWTTETLGEFRARIKIALRTQITSATLPEIREMIAVLLDVDPRSLELREPEGEILILEPRIPADAVGASNVRPNVLNELLGDVSAAGVNANVVLLAKSSSIRVVADSVEHDTLSVGNLSAAELWSISEGEGDLSDAPQLPTQNSVEEGFVIGSASDVSTATLRTEAVSSTTMGELSNGSSLA
jgi:hypothetical protein